MDRIRNRFYLIMILTSLVMIGGLVTVLLRDRNRGINIEAELTQLSEAVGDQAVTLTAVASYTPPPEPTATPEPTPTPHHLQTVQAEATAIVEQRSALLEAAQNDWEIALAGEFDDGNYTWQTDAGDDEFSIATRRVIDGAYVWEVEAKTGFFWIETPLGNVWEDFALSAEMSQSFHGVGQQGLVFRVGDSNNFYYFFLCAQQQAYRAGRRVDGDWFPLITCTNSDAISQTEPNRLGIVAQGNQFLLSINDQYVGEMLDTKHASGRFGVLIEMDAEDVNTYTFHNYKVKIPENNDE